MLGEPGPAPAENVGQSINKPVATDGGRPAVDDPLDDQQRLESARRHARWLAKWSERAGVNPHTILREELDERDEDHDGRAGVVDGDDCPVCFGLLPDAVDCPRCDEGGGRVLLPDGGVVRRQRRLDEHTLDDFEVDDEDGDECVCASDHDLGCFEHYERERGDDQ